MNNKGFAITTLIYGLTVMGTLLIIIIMATLSSTRNNVKELASSIEKELLAYNDGNISYKATFSENKTYSFAPAEGQAGFYRIELWGPQGNASGTGGYSCDGGKGAYTSGIIYLNEGQNININVGKCTSNSTITATNPGVAADSRDIIMLAKSGSSRPAYIVGAPSLDTASVTKGTNIYTFYDTIMIPNVNAGVGRATIEKLPTKVNSSSISENTLNGKYWENIDRIHIELTGNTTIYNSGQCKLYYKYHNTSGYSTNVYSIIRQSDDINLSGVDISDISLKCDESVDYSGLVFYIYMHSAKYGSYTTIYHDEYNPTDITGVKLSAFQPDAVSNKPKHGKYYIIPASKPTHAITAPANDEKSFDPVTLYPISGENRQKWIIDMVVSRNGSYQLYDKIPNTTGEDEFRIVESARYRALDIKKDENIFGNLISAQYQFNTLSKSDPQLWKLVPNKDGTYSIETIIPGSGQQATGYLTYGKPETSIANAYRDINDDSIYIGNKGSKPQANQKFKLYALDMSTSAN